jgi:hypothetical protein
MTDSRTNYKQEIIVTEKAVSPVSTSINTETVPAGLFKFVLERAISFSDLQPHKTQRMKKNRNSDVSKTGMAGYLLAIMIAVQPMLNSEVDYNSRPEVIRYVVRLMFAAAIAFFTKYAGNESSLKN